MLTVCPTPIGNLEDLTLRVIRAIESADLIACEDTRTTIKLLNHLQVKKPMMSYHEHNEQGATAVILDKLDQGLHVVLVSDAGMPGISDPGEVLIKACIEKGMAYTVLPGPSAAITALVASNLPTQPYYFEGFLDRNKRKKRLEALKSLEATMIFYESPHRVVKTLEDMLLVFGNRQVTLARELTKRYETYWHTDFEAALESFQSGTVTPKGEYVLVVGGCDTSEALVPELQIEVALKQLLDEGVRLKDAAKTLSKQYPLDRQEIYKIGLTITSDV